MLTELFWALPFVILLGSIAILPLVQKHWWEKNFHFVSFGLALIVVLHYLFQLHNSESLAFSEWNGYSTGHNLS